MANLKNIRDRICSIQSTQKITRAMKMVAAAKVKKSENRVKSSRPFTQELKMMFYKLLTSLDNQVELEVAGDKPLDKYPLLLQNRDIKNAGILIVTSNKGLAGAFNVNVIRFALNRIAEYKEKGINCKLFVVGQKGLAPLKKVQESLGFKIFHSYTKFSADPTSASATIVAEDMAKAFIEGEIDSIEIITTRFRNMMSYSVEDWNILPFQKEENKPDEEVVLDLEMDFEPDISSILQKIVPLYIANTMFQAFLESVASELASRMTAMSAASNNADEMIRTLTIDYNKARQAAITQEITEVVSGADSLK